MSLKRSPLDDPIYGSIEFHKPVVYEIIETPLFQRLRDIKQLGGLSFIYPEAQHTRYEHCIGTYHCALKMMRHLEANSNLKINDFYLDCVTIAGLLHDIGHGPFSHMWESVSSHKIKHEENSVHCVDEIFKNIKLFDDNHSHYTQANGVALIKALIRGNINLECLTKEMKDKINEDERTFIFGIINNSSTGIDVDKWDYLKRDKHYLKKHINFNLDCLLGGWDRIDFVMDEIFTKSKIINDVIVYNSWRNIYHLYDLRSQLFINFYHMPLNQTIERFIIECAKLSDDRNYTIKEYNKKFSKISGSDIDIFLKLTDTKLMKFFESTCDKDIIKFMNYINNKDKIEIQLLDNNDKLSNNQKIFEVKIDYPGHKMIELRNKVEIYDTDGIREHKYIGQRGFYRQFYQYQLSSINNNEE